MNDDTTRRWVFQGTPEVFVSTVRGLVEVTCPPFFAWDSLHALLVAYSQRPPTMRDPTFRKVLFVHKNDNNTRCRLCAYALPDNRSLIAFDPENDTPREFLEDVYVWFTDTLAPWLEDTVPASEIPKLTAGDTAFETQYAAAGVSWETLPEPTLENPKSDAGDTAQSDQAGEPPQPSRRDVADRVREVHNLLKDGKTTRTAAFQKTGTDKKTYRRYCEGVTGEKPLG